MISHSMDISVMRARQANMDANRGAARDAAVAVAATRILRRVVGGAVGAGLRMEAGGHGEFWGKAYDTGRYARAYAMAHNMLAGVWASGVLPMPLPQLRSSAYLGVVRRRLELQIKRLEKDRAYWDRLRKRDETNPGHRRWKSYRQKLKVIARIDEVLELTEAQLEIAVDADRPGASVDDGAAVFIAGRRTKTLYRKSNVGRVIRTVYGGEARIIRASGRSFAEMRNMEPHARIVERRTRLMARSIASEQRSVGGLRRIGNKHLAVLMLNDSGTTRAAAA